MSTETYVIYNVEPVWLRKGIARVNAVPPPEM
jgi:hypothetical protein